MSEKPSIGLVVEQPAGRLTDLQDDDLMLLAKRGRQDAFEILVKRHQVLVYGLATRFLGDKTQGRDVTQDVFLSLWAERDRYRARGRFRSYLVSVALHRCHHVARQRKTGQEKLAQLMETSDAGAETPEIPLAALVEQERAREVRQALTKLPEKCRQVMTLRFTQDLPLEDIAEITGMPMGTVKSHVFRGLKRLHVILQKDQT